MTRVDPILRIAQRPYAARRLSPEDRAVFTLLIQLRRRAGEPSSIEIFDSTPWQSALFQGQRAIFNLEFAGENYAERAEAFAGAMGSIDWPLPGYFVADITLDSMHAGIVGTELRLSALIIKDW
ncbi:hypothetical protein [Sphingobium sp.]|uniref:hypothetical protein n=1 Tax=Sphingobium sp. TaxID=1912891 RepID=UPI00261C6221|nr:hypothetical protein [Sphingobium sp.]